MINGFLTLTALLATFALLLPCAAVLTALALEHGLRFPRHTPLASLLALGLLGGCVGPVGPAGERGVDGVAIVGSKGDMGATGRPGARGATGATGATGPAGQSIVGPRGPAGAPGKDGLSGALPVRRTVCAMQVRSSFARYSILAFSDGSVRTQCEHWSKVYRGPGADSVQKHVRGSNFWFGHEPEASTKDCVAGYVGEHEGPWLVMRFAKDRYFYVYEWGAHTSGPVAFAEEECTTITREDAGQP